MSHQENAYKKILKATSLFGAVQFSNLLISAVRHKFFAVLIGPAGYGTLSILFTGFDLVRQATGLGVDVTGVKKISENTDEAFRNKAASIIIKVSVITGLLGMLLFIALSYNLSIWAFGHPAYTLAIILISGGILLRQITAAQGAVMQGMGRLRFLAKTSLYGNFIGLLSTLPLFYFFKTDAILPSILISALITFLISRYYYNKLGFSPVNIPFKQAVRQGKDMLYFGTLISIHGLLPLLSGYIIQLYINHTGGKADVGFYNIGQTIINSYVGIIFTAMTMEYYPRLAGFNRDATKESAAVSQQAIFSVLLILPVIILFLECQPLIIRLLFSEKFTPALPMLSWLMLAMFFKAISFSIGYLIIARADSAVFLKTGLISNTVSVSLCIFGYQVGGLEGLGQAFFIYYALHIAIVYSFTRLKYSLVLDKQLLKIIFTSLIIFIPAVGAIVFAHGLLKHIVLLVLFVVSCSFSYYQLNRRVKITALIKGFITKKR